jgi:HD-like signal output (HDOD) protein
MTDKTVTRKILRSIENIPMLSPSAAHLLALCEDCDHGLMDIIKIVKNDSVLTARLLRTANSPAYCRTMAITSVDRAVSLLGEDIVVSLALEEATTSVFHRQLTGYESGQEDLWRHDIKTAIAAKKLNRYVADRQSTELAFTSGMLHDLGKSVIADWLGRSPEQKNIIENIEKGRFNDFLEAEEKILGLTHAQAGFAVAKRWGLPTPLASVILYHHAPSYAQKQFRPLCYIVHLADFVAMMGGSGTGSDSLRYRMDTDILRYIPIGEDDLAVLFLEVEEEYKSTIASIKGMEEKSQPDC